MEFFFVQISSFYKNTSYIGLGPLSMISFQLINPIKSLSNKVTFGATED